jgi:hypothetical protein
VSERVLLDRALGEARPGNRNDKGFWLACQLRDNGYGRGETEAVLREYVARVPAVAANPYTVEDALASVAQAFTRPPSRPCRLYPCRYPPRSARCVAMARACGS